MLSLSRRKKIFFTISLALIISGGFFIPKIGLAQNEAQVMANTGQPGDATAAAGGTSDAAVGTTPSSLSLSGALINGLTWFLNKISLIILTFFGLLLGIAGSLLEAAMSVEKFNGVPIITKGWDITRGLCNMFFALALLIMAFATILRIERYGMKEYLWKIVVAALLINFSLVIGGIFIDFAQVFTHYFLEAAKGTHQVTGGIAGQLTNAMRVMAVYKEPTGFAQAIAQTGNTASNFFISTFFGAIILLIASFTLLAAAVFFLIRIPVIWLLLIFSPFAWLSWALPGKAGSIWDKWWSNFLKWVFFAPIYSFFIYLAVFTAGEGQGTGQTSFQQLFAQVQNQPVNTAGETVSAIFNGGMWQIMQYIIIIIILLGGLVVAQSFGIYGAKGVMGMGKWMAGAAGGFVQRKLQEGAKAEGTGGKLSNAWARFRRGTAYLAPDTWKEGWKKRREQKEREARGVATGAAHDLFNKILSFGKEKSDYKVRAQRARIAEEEKDIEGENSEELVRGYMDSMDRGRWEKAAGYLQKLSRKNNQNELLRHFNDNLKDANGNPYQYTMDPAGMNQFIEEQLGSKMGDQNGKRFAHDINNIMEGNGQWVGRGTKVNPNTGKWEYAEVNEGHVKIVEDQLKFKIELANKELSDIKTSPVYKTDAERAAATKGVETRLNEINRNLKELQSINLKELNTMKISDRSSVGKSLFNAAARQAAYVEWTKQDPQVQTRGTGRFSYVHEGYDIDGRNIDLGMDQVSLQMLSSHSTKNVGRFHTQSHAITVINHSDEFKKANRGFYDELIEIHAGQTKDVSDAELDEYVHNLAETVPAPAGADGKADFAKKAMNVEKFKQEIIAARQKPQKKE